MGILTSSKKKAIFYLRNFNSYMSVLTGQALCIKSRDKKMLITKTGIDDNDMIWLAAIHKALSEFAGTEIRKLIDEYYFEKQGRVATFRTRAIGESTFHSWQKEFIEDVIYFAAIGGIEDAVIQGHKKHMLAILECLKQGVYYGK